MAGEIFYFCFSLILFIGITLYLVNLILIRASGKTTFGITYKAGTPERKKVTELASNRNMSITAFIALALGINMAYCVNRLAHLNNPKYSQGLFVLLAAFIVFIFVLMIPISRKQARVISELGVTRKKK